MAQTVGPTRYAAEGEVIDEPIWTHFWMATAASAGILSLMGVMALATGGIVVGWWLALYAIPLVLLVLSGLAALHTFRAAT